MVVCTQSLEIAVYTVKNELADPCCHINRLMRGVLWHIHNGNGPTVADHERQLECSLSSRWLSDTSTIWIDWEWFHTCWIFTFIFLHIPCIYYYCFDQLVSSLVKKIVVDSGGERENLHRYQRAQVLRRCFDYGCLLMRWEEVLLEKQCSFLPCLLLWMRYKL